MIKTAGVFLLKTLTKRIIVSLTILHSRHFQLLLTDQMIQNRFNNNSFISISLSVLYLRQLDHHFKGFLIRRATQEVISLCLFTCRWCRLSSPRTTTLMLKLCRSWRSRLASVEESYRLVNKDKTHDARYLAGLETDGFELRDNALNVLYALWIYNRTAAWSV